MRSQISKSEVALRTQFDFSKGMRGKFHERYKKGSTVTLLDERQDSDDSLQSGQGDSQLTEVFGKNLLISHLVTAGFEVAQPVRDKGIDLIAYRDGKDGRTFLACPIQLKASAHESFSLDKKYELFPRLLIAYVWNVQGPEQSDVYALTFGDAMHVMEEKGYAKTDSWTKKGYYFVRSAGHELKEILEPYKMTPKRWQEKLQAI
ncbi:MAG: hypothetical protein WAK26_01215 [Terracidiphilus sp.]|jgi:hypothetical protein